MEPTQGHIEADSNALAEMSNAIREVERRMIPNETIARVIVQSTSNAFKIACEITKLEK